MRSVALSEQDFSRLEPLPRHERQHGLQGEVARTRFPHFTSERQDLTQPEDVERQQGTVQDDDRDNLFDQGERKKGDIA